MSPKPSPIKKRTPTFPHSPLLLLLLLFFLFFLFCLLLLLLFFPPVHCSRTNSPHPSLCYHKILFFPTTKALSKIPHTPSTVPFPCTQQPLSLPSLQPRTQNTCTNHAKFSHSFHYCQIFRHQLLRLLLLLVAVVLVLLLLLLLLVRVPPPILPPSLSLSLSLSLSGPTERLAKAPELLPQRQNDYGTECNMLGSQLRGDAEKTTEKRVR
jgi:hypothetical protein